MSDVREESIDDGQLHGETEPPPLGGDLFALGYNGAVPFGSPPAEPVTIEGEIPWELRDDIADAPSN